MDTTKVVINACFGGFGLSLEAKREYLRRAGLEWTEVPSLYPSFDPSIYVGDDLWSAYDIERTDPILIAMVEERGSRWVGGAHTALEIVELPKGTLYRIDEYDGNEAIETRDGIDWNVA